MLFCLDFAFLKFGFPRFFRKSGKSKQKICFLLFGFHIFYNWISRIFVWISPVLNQPHEISSNTNCVQSDNFIRLKSTPLFMPHHLVNVILIIYNILINHSLINHIKTFLNLFLDENVQELLRRRCSIVEDDNPASPISHGSNNNAARQLQQVSQVQQQHVFVPPTSPALHSRTANTGASNVAPAPSPVSNYFAQSPGVVSAPLSNAPPSVAQSPGFVNFGSPAISHNSPGPQQQSATTSQHNQQPSSVPPQQSSSSSQSASQQPGSHQQPLSVSAQSPSGFMSPANANQQQNYSIQSPANFSGIYLSTF
jgi:hypothetical protein